MATTPPFSSSYIVTNRNDPYTIFVDSTTPRQLPAHQGIYRRSQAARRRAAL
jgi:hypothetical protein